MRASLSKGNRASTLTSHDKCLLCSTRSNVTYFQMLHSGKLSGHARLSIGPINEEPENELFAAAQIRHQSTIHPLIAHLDPNTKVSSSSEFQYAWMISLQVGSGASPKGAYHSQTEAPILSHVLYKTPHHFHNLWGCQVGSRTDELGSSIWWTTCKRTADAGRAHSLANWGNEIDKSDDNVPEIEVTPMYLHQSHFTTSRRVHNLATKFRGYSSGRVSLG